MAEPMAAILARTRTRFSPRSGTSLRPTNRLTFRLLRPLLQAPHRSTSTSPQTRPTPAVQLFLTIGTSETDRHRRFPPYLTHITHRECSMLASPLPIPRGEGGRFDWNFRYEPAIATRKRGSAAHGSTGDVRGALVSDAGFDRGKFWLFVEPRCWSAKTNDTACPTGRLLRDVILCAGWPPI